MTMDFTTANPWAPTMASNSVVATMLSIPGITLPIDSVRQHVIVIVSAPSISYSIASRMCLLQVPTLMHKKNLLSTPHYTHTTHTTQHIPHTTPIDITGQRRSARSFRYPLERRQRQGRHHD